MRCRFNRSFFRVYYRSANVKAFTKHLWDWMCCMPGVPICRTWRCGYVLQYLQNLLTAWVIWQFFIFWVVHEKPELCDSLLQKSNRDSFDIGSLWLIQCVWSQSLLFPLCGQFCALLMLLDIISWRMLEILRKTGESDSSRCHEDQMRYDLNIFDYIILL